MEPKVPDWIGAVPKHQGVVMQNPVELAIQRILKAYALMWGNQRAEDARTKVADYLQTLFAGGETDEERLAVCGLVYLREKDGRSNPVREGFSGM